VFDVNQQIEVVQEGKYPMKCVPQTKVNQVP